MNPEVFPILILIGRPASGKSEIIHHLENLDPAQRRQLHIGEPRVIDDFPMLWTWFEEDGLLERMGRERLHTDSEGYFKADYLWDLLIRRLCLECAKHEQERGPGSTVILEFSRGSSHGGYRRAFAQMPEALLEQAAVLYVQVSFQESLRKNRRRFNPQAPHSILEHSLPDAKLERLYGEDDWFDLSGGDPRFLRLGQLRVAYAVFENEEDLTTAGGEPLHAGLRACCEDLWRAFRQKGRGQAGGRRGEQKGPEG